MTVRRALMVIVGLVGLLLVMLDLRSTAAQQAEAAVTPISWLGVTGLIAMLGVAVVWGRMQQQGRTQGRQIERLFHAASTIVPRLEVDRRIQEVRQETREIVGRIETKLDALAEKIR